MTSNPLGSAQAEIHSVHWHEDRIRGCVHRADITLAEADPEEPCAVEWLDLACLFDIARTWIAEQEAMS